MLEPEGQSLTFKILHSQTFRWTFLLLTVLFSLVSIISMMGGLFQTGGQLAALASAFATILLVSLTAQYALLTQELVEESETSRIQRQEQRQQEREREIRALRRALYEEIGEIVNLDEYAEQYQVSRSIIRLNAPTTIYESNAGKIGLLSDNEIEHIVAYYTALDHVEEMLRLQRELDTTINMDFVTEYFERVGALMDWFIRTISFGRFGQRHAKDREEYIQGQIEELSETQSAALSAIEEHLEEE